MATSLSANPTSAELQAAGYSLQDTNEGGDYANYAWVNPSGGQSFDPYAIQQNDGAAQAAADAAAEKAGNFKYMNFGQDEEGGVGTRVAIPNADPNFKVADSLSQSSVFQDVNSHSGGALNDLYSSINSGSYAVKDGTLYTGSGNSYSIQPTGTDGVGYIRTRGGGSSDGYAVAVGYDPTTGKASMPDSVITGGGIQYIPGQSGGVIKNIAQSLGPVGNIALAALTGGASIPEQLAAQTALNMAKGQNIGQALTSGALATVTGQGINSLAGAAGTTSALDAGAGSDFGTTGNFANPTVATNSPVVDSAGPIETSPLGPAPVDATPPAPVNAAPPNPYAPPTGSDYVSGAATEGTTTPTNDALDANSGSDFGNTGNVGAGPSASDAAPSDAAPPNPYSLADTSSGTGLTMNSTGEGLTAGTSANLADMGGGQGLTTAGAGGIGELSSAGLDSGSLTAAGLGGTLGSDLAATSAGVSSALANAGIDPATGNVIAPVGGSGSSGSSGLTTAGLLAGGAGLAALLALMQSDSSRYGTPGRATYSGVLSQMPKFNPSTFQASRPDPNMFRPTGVTTVAQQAAQQTPTQQAPTQQAPQRTMSPFDTLMSMTGGGQQQQNPMQMMARMAGIGYAGGGSVKPQYTSKSQLASMDPWTRAGAEYQNDAYQAQSPVAPTAAPTGPALGQLNLSGGGLGSYSDGGHMLKGPGDGMSDSIPATIGGKRPARLADGEFVVSSDVVSGLGNGSTEAGARQLYKMMDRIRQARTGTKKQGKKINPEKFLPK
jgi:hypothetical protein